MSDFGANIFDDASPRPRPPKPAASGGAGAGQSAPARPGGPEPGPDAPAIRQHRHERFRRERTPREVQAAADAAARATADARTPPASRPPIAAACSILIDLDALEAEAGRLDAELSLHRLRQALGGPHEVVRAIGFVGAARRAPKGFDLLEEEDTIAGGMRLATIALDLLRSAPTLVLAPPTEALRGLADGLLAAGHAVELAGFAAAKDVRQLGRDCLFQP